MSPAPPGGPAAARPAPIRVSVAALQRASLWLLVASGAIAIVEPSPYEAAFLIALGTFAATGLRLRACQTPLVLLLVGFNIGGIFSLVPFLGEQPSVMFIAISVYLALTCIFFAACLADDTAARLDTVRHAYLTAALVATLCGVLGYFNVAGLAEPFTRFGRASGTFKDANVLGPFLVLPFVYLMQDLLTGRARRPLLTLLLAAFIGLGIFLSFSRGAWGDVVLSTLMMALLTFATARSAALRARVVLSALLGLGVVALLLAGALSIERVREVFEQRASLDQSYDLGVTGRFGNQLRSLSELLERPNGYGPLRFRTHFPEDPHNVYVNAFASYGWLGGFSYLGLIAATLLVGWRTVLRPTPWRRHAIAIWSTLFVQIVQGLQIDTDHWRHFYLMLGAVWAIAAADAAWARQVSMKKSTSPSSRS